MDWDEETSKSYKKEEPAIGEREIEKVKQLVSELKQLSEKEGCSVVELVEKYSDSEGEAEEQEAGPDNSDKIAMIAARMKREA